MKAMVNDTCSGCGLCEQTCPEVFVLEGDKAIVKGDAVPADAEETCKQAAEECPDEAIIIE